MFDDNIAFLGLSSPFWDSYSYSLAYLFSMPTWEEERIVLHNASLCKSIKLGFMFSHSYIVFRVSIQKGTGQSCWEHSGSAGLIGSDCGHLLAIRPAWDGLCICVCALSCSRERGQRERELWHRQSPAATKPHYVPPLWHPVII